MEDFIDSEQDYFGFFSAAIPPLAGFSSRVGAVARISSKNWDIPAQQLCIIGLAAYFEAFCKDQFAAIINICPQALESFAGARDSKISATSLLHHIEHLPRKLGFLVAEDHDFGSAKLINSLYKDLLRITPFSENEAGDYSKFLNLRNLLVHHGGVYTSKYARQTGEIEAAVRRRPHFDSVEITNDDVKRWTEFLLKIADKTATAAFRGLQEFSKERRIIFDEDRKEAIKYLLLKMPVTWLTQA